MFNSLLTWGGDHPMAFTLIWLCFGAAFLAMLEIFDQGVDENDLSRIFFIALWPGFFLGVVMAFVITILLQTVKMPYRWYKKRYR